VDPGQVTVGCTTDDDVHSVTALGREPTIGIHVHGGDISTIRRQAYDPATGASEWFVSAWDDPEAGVVSAAPSVGGRSAPPA
jgi:predicted metal-dependent enzyme (double-stranded beta helix superfamily)